MWRGFVRSYRGTLRCSCPAGRYGRACRHRLLVLERQREESMRVALRNSAPDAGDGFILTAKGRAALVQLRCDVCGHTSGAGEIAAIETADATAYVRAEACGASADDPREMALPAYRTDPRPFSIWR